MPKRITRVKWTASEIPSGLSFNESTGTFSGTATDVEEYTVPVTVETNYGTDTKDVKVNVETKAYPLYVVGYKVNTWGSGTSTSEGLKKVNIPDVISIDRCCFTFSDTDATGFVACCRGGKVYGCGDVYIPSDGGLGSVKTYSSPVELNDGYIQRVLDSNDRNTAWKAYCVMRKRGAKSIRVDDISDGTVKEISIEIDKAPLTSEFGYTVLLEDGITWYENGSLKTRPKVEALKKYILLPDTQLVKNNAKYMTMSVLALNEAGVLYELDSGNIIAEGVKDFWAYVITQTQIGTLNFYYQRNIFIQKNDGQLYVQGTTMAQKPSTSYGNILGLGDVVDTNSEFISLGSYDVKKMCFSRFLRSFFLTTDGKLYHSGYRDLKVQTSSSGYFSDTTNYFTQILSNYKIQDFTYVNDEANSGSLLVTVEV